MESTLLLAGGVECHNNDNTCAHAALRPRVDGEKKGEEREQEQEQEQAQSLEGLVLLLVVSGIVRNETRPILIASPSPSVAPRLLCAPSTLSAQHKHRPHKEIDRS